MTQPINVIAPSVQLKLGLCILMFLSLATAPYLWLIGNFEYDDILRAPTAEILIKFHAGGSALVVAWLGFAISALLFIPVAFGFHQLGAGRATGTRFLGTLSALLQAAGLLRWVLVVPLLATRFQDPTISDSTREAVALALEVVHRYGGMIVGEMLGQLLLAAWTALVCKQLWRDRTVPRWLALFGALTLPFWIVGQTELLHAVIPEVPSIEVTPIAFIAWELWLALLAVVFLRQAWRGLSSPT